MYKALSEKLTNFNCYGLPYLGWEKGEVAYKSIEEAALDLFSEQAIWPTILSTLQAAYEVLHAAGFNDEAILYEMYLSKEPAEVFERQASVPYFGHVGDPVAVELHDVNVIRADLSAGGRNRPTLAGMRPIENSVGGDIVPSVVRRK